MKWVTLNDMYKSCKANNLPLLSNGLNSVGEYWNDYLNNFANYDKFIARRYKSFRYFSQVPVNRFSELTTEHIAEVTDDWLSDCAMWLLANDKRYRELYRIHGLSEEAYSIIDNYNITETMEKETSKSEADVYGSRVDTTEDTLGEREDSSSDTLGAREDSISDTIGARQDISTDSVAGFNSSGFENADKTQLNTGAQSNSRSATTGAQSNSHTNTIGEQENSKTFTKGYQSDNHTGEGTEEYTLTREGNIGVKSVPQILEEDKRFWEKWDFYMMIFREMNREFLLV